MIPQSNLEYIYFKIIGDSSLLAMAQTNLLSHLEKVAKVRTHTYFANNGQTEYGISHNFGALRCYTWEDTVIDCRNSPNMADNEYLRDYPMYISENKKFINFKKDLESRMGGYIEIDPFCSVLRGEDNMRYNIRRMSKVDDFDIVRVGITLEAASEADFKKGLLCLKDHENPFKMKKHIQAQQHLVYQ